MKQITTFILEGENMALSRDTFYSHASRLSWDKKHRGLIL